MGTLGCLETSLRNYHYTLRNDPEECRSQLGVIVGSEIGTANGVGMQGEFKVHTLILLKPSGFFTYHQV
jgi:hypothetical protein